MIVLLEQVGKIFQVGQTVVHALEGIDLQVDSGEFTAIAGTSGSGKSTLLNLIGGLENCSSGTVRMSGVDIATLSGRELARWRARHLGFIFQTFNLLPVLTVYENVEYPLLLTETSHAVRRERVKDLLRLVGLEPFQEHRPRQLSGGQRQRVAIARALANQPTLVLADEPTANLDHEIGMGIIKLLQDINQAMQTTFLIATHDPAIIGQARRVISLRDGKLS